jgi:hypothetical protein
LSEEDRNEVSLGKNVIYVAAPPGVQASVDFVSPWTYPQEGAGKVAYPDIQDAIDYLKAFYYGLPVQQLSSPRLSFTAWSTGVGNSKAKSPTPRFIGLDTSTKCIRIRTRSSANGIFKRQLNLDDLLDAAISILPDDAFALLLLVRHDLYENADDIFTCGCSYGGSRVAVISTARSNPVLDHRQNVEREHAWPASHCKAYVETMCAAEALPAKRPKKRPKVQKVFLADLHLIHGSLILLLPRYRPPCPRIALHSLQFRPLYRRQGYPLARSRLSHSKPRARPLFWYRPLRLLRLHNAGQRVTRRRCPPTPLPLSGRSG